MTLTNATANKRSMLWWLTPMSSTIAAIATVNNMILQQVPTDKNRENLMIE